LLVSLINTEETDYADLNQHRTVSESYYFSDAATLNQEMEAEYANVGVER
jgi:hypothetical protein